MAEPAQDCKLSACLRVGADYFKLVVLALHFRFKDVESVSKFVLLVRTLYDKLAWAFRVIGRVCVVPGGHKWCLSIRIYRGHIQVVRWLIHSYLLLWLNKHWFLWRRLASDVPKVCQNVVVRYWPDLLDTPSFREINIILFFQRGIAVDHRQGSYLLLSFGGFETNRRLIIKSVFLFFSVIKILEYTATMGLFRFFSLVRYLRHIFFLGVILNSHV